MDTKTVGELLRERLDERLGRPPLDDNPPSGIAAVQWDGTKARWAIYERYAEQMKGNQGKCEYVAGSLCELEMIDAYIAGKDDQKVRETAAGEEKRTKNPPSVHILTDVIYESSKGNVVGTCQLLDGTQFSIEKCQYDTLRDARSTDTMIEQQYLIMQGCLKPGSEESKTKEYQIALPVLSAGELIRRYFFSGMQWPDRRVDRRLDRLVEKTYFNLEERMVFFQFSPRDS